MSGEGIEVPELEKLCEPSDCRLAVEACKIGVHTCLGLIATLSGGGIVQALVERVESEMQGPGMQFGKETEFEETDWETA